MKNTCRLSIFILLFSLSGILSCDQDTESTEPDLSGAEQEALYDETFEEVDGITESALDFFNMNARTTEDTEDEFIRCGKKTHDFENKTITIDFGDGCEGPGGRIRKGKIIIKYTDRMFNPGAVITITFEDFYISDIKIEGVITRTNISTSLDDNPKFRIDLTGGKLTWPDGTFATREMSHIRTWIRSGSPRQDEFTIEGYSSGMNRRGYTYEIIITNTLHFRRACWVSRVFIPVEGTKLIQIEGKDDMMIDYGDGTCDTLATITVNGVSREVDLRKWKK